MIKIKDGTIRTVRRYQGVEFDKLCVQQNVKFPTKVMVWTTICAKGLGLSDICIVYGIINLHIYKSTLEIFRIEKI